MSNVELRPLDRHGVNPKESAYMMNANYNRQLKPFAADMARETRKKLLQYRNYIRK